MKVRKRMEKIKMKQMRNRMEAKNRKELKWEIEWEKIEMLIVLLGRLRIKMRTYIKQLATTLLPWSCTSSHLVTF